jgi:hypothetical protein
MKKLLVLLAIPLLATIAPVNSAQAQIPIIEIIKAGVTKVIKAVDLKIQRLQNKTIWLQNAQKSIENTLSKLKLDEISDWVERQRVLYKDYFEELSKVKSIIAYYHRIREITEKQVRLVDEYKRAYSLFKQDENFTPEEILYMGKVYTGILDESVKNLDQVFLIINSFATQMSDAKRLEIINTAADQIEANYSDMKTFNRENILLSIQRARDARDVEVVRALYGLE